MYGRLVAMNICKAQDYNLSASFDTDGDLVLTGKCSVLGTVNLYVSYWDLLDPASTYGGNPQFSLTKGGDKQAPQNNIYAWVLGDFFAGLNIGALGSTVQLNNTNIGEMQSSEWFSALPSRGLLFDKLWTGGQTNYWNQWAQELNGMSDAYNFAYAERFSAPQISLNPATADTLTLVLLDADVTKAGS